MWHVCIALVTIALGIGCTVHTAHFAHSRDNPQNFASINGYLGSGIWCGAVFLILGIATVVVVPLQGKYMTKRMAVSTRPISKQFLKYTVEFAIEYAFKRECPS